MSSGKSTKVEPNNSASIPPTQRLKNLENEQPPDVPNPSITIEFYIMRARELYKHGNNFLESGVLEQAFHNCLRAYTILDKRLQMHPEYVTVKPEILEELSQLHTHTKELVEQCKKQLLQTWELEYQQYLQKQVAAGQGVSAITTLSPAKGKTKKNKKAPVATSISSTPDPLPPPTPFAPAPEPQIKILKPASVKKELGAGDQNVTKVPEQQSVQQPLNFRPVGTPSVFPLPMPTLQQMNPPLVSNLSNGPNKLNISSSTPALSSTSSDSKSFQVLWNNQFFEASKDNIKVLLKCESCRDYLQPPIYLCPNGGHSGCVKCKNKECGTCQVPFTKIRNLAVETLVEQYFVSCSYKRSGCTSKLFNHELDVHKKKCNYRPFECNLVGSHHNCSKTVVSIGKIQDHIRNGHGLRNYESDTLMWTETVKMDDEGWKFNFQQQRDHFTLGCFGQLFLISSEWRSGTLFWIIFLVGNKDDANMFKGEITVGDDTKISQIKWSGSVSSFRFSPLQIYQRGHGLILCSQQMKGIGTVESKKQYKLEFNIKISQIP